MSRRKSEAEKRLNRINHNQYSAWIQWRALIDAKTAEWIMQDPGMRSLISLYRSGNGKTEVGVDGLKTNDEAKYARMCLRWRAGCHNVDGLAAKAHVTLSEAEDFIRTRRASERTKRKRQAIGVEKGVFRHRGRKDKPWMVYIAINCVRHYGGSYATVQEANAAARQLRERIAHEQAADTQ